MKKQHYLFGSALFVFASLVGVFGGLVGAEGNPVVYEKWKSGNAVKECKQLGEFKYSFKIDNAPKNGVYEDKESGNVFTISNATKKVFDWAATDPVSSVIVKAGTGANVWNYSPQANSDTGLYGFKNKDISHVTFCWNDEYYFQFDKKWTGDKIDTTKVKVVFTADGGFTWTLGTDSPVMVEPGETTLTNVKEVVTGLPENCESTSDVPATITAPKEGYDDENLFTLTVTNTVTCEDVDEEEEDNGVVLADVTPTPQVTVTPVGAADAGGAGTTALIGLVGSTVAVSLGAVIRKFSL